MITAAEAMLITAHENAVQRARVSPAPGPEVPDRAEHAVRMEDDSLVPVTESPRPRGISVEPDMGQTGVSVEQLSRVLLDSLERVNYSVQAMSDVARRVSVALTLEGRS